MHVSVARETATLLTPGAAERPDSTVEVHDEHVMPYILRVTVSARIGGIRVASKPMSDISCHSWDHRNTVEIRSTYVNELFRCPNAGVIFNDPSLSQERNLDGMDTLLISEHAFYSLVGWDYDQ